MINFNNLNFEDYVREQRKYGLDYETFFANFSRGLAPLNFDADSKKHARKIARLLLKRFKGEYAVLYRKSAGRRGYHFTVFYRGRQLFLPFKKVIALRKRYKDCYGRLWCDMKRMEKNMPISILFNHYKAGEIKKAGIWRELRNWKDL
jgi:hypothetical protein